MVSLPSRLFFLAIIFLYITFIHIISNSSISRGKSVPLFLAGKAFIKHKKQKDSKLYPLPDLFIGAHAAVVGLEIMTRDISRFRSYFPTMKLVTPEML